MIPKLADFFPKTYRLDVMSDEIQFINDKSSGIWIYKPRNLNQGRGIKLIEKIRMERGWNKSQLQEYLIDKTKIESIARILIYHS